ncbi:protein O-mannose kinase-like [Lineus longissimus]|uniref:protein O-mannose kinase-like n=1 Tax=Lineus longissimus TaxID=88925 RepID=UPI002B4E21DB
MAKWCNLDEEEDEPSRGYFWRVYITDSLHVILPVLFAGAVTLYGFYPPLGAEEELECRHDYVKDEHVCYQPCEHGSFFLPGMKECRSWLTCQDLEKDVHIGSTVDRGVVKLVQLADWKGHKVAVNSLTQDEYKADFHHGLEMLKAFQPHARVTQFIGSCDDTFITEYHHFKSAVQLEQTLQIPQHLQINNLTTRFQLCLDYAEILASLHNSSIGKRVMCDSNDLQKTLEQYLVTYDIRLIVNDLDALPEVKDGQGIKCGHRQLTGDFVAPEQLWPYPDVEFSDKDMSGYDEKIDIWKVPDICLFFIGDKRGTDVLKFHLHKIHTKCKNSNPKLRPSADDLLEEYMRVRKYIGLHSYKEL